MSRALSKRVRKLEGAQPEQASCRPHLIIGDDEEAERHLAEKIAAGEPPNPLIRVRFVKAHEGKPAPENSGSEETS